MDKATFEELPVIDSAVISRLKAFDPEGARGLVRRLVTLYLESAPATLADIRRCKEAAALQELRQHAHKFKTTNANLGLMRMYALLEDLEQQLVSESVEIPEHGALVEQIEAEGARAIDALRTL